MAATDAQGIGRRIKRFRTEKGMSGADLAEKAKISRSYLSELENGTGAHKRPSADVMYRIGRALGVTMSELLGRPLINEPQSPRPASLLRFAEEHKLPETDIEMLASIRFRGDVPQTPERWSFIYNAIKSSVAMDQHRRRS
jgi:transcriptional regulator with XRE-family HTH domain